MLKSDNTDHSFEQFKNWDDAKFSKKGCRNVGPQQAAITPFLSL
jgi:hypothetical protein